MVKNSVSFTKNIVADVKVKVINASKVKLTGNKMKEALHKDILDIQEDKKVLNLAMVAEKKGTKK